MIAGSLRKISLVALLVATAALLVPSAAQAAAPQVYCVIAYGHENPGTCEKQPALDAPSYQGRVYPMSQPYGYGSKGVLFVEGFAEPNVSFTASVTDGSRTISRTGTTTATGAFKADIKAASLGVHASTPTNLYGVSTLTVSVISTVGGQVSDPKTTTIDKYAIAPGDQTTPAVGLDPAIPGKDKYAPVFKSTKYPPTMVHQEVPFFTCCLEGTIEALVEDDNPSAFGHASEIASLTVKIEQGGVMIRDFGNVAIRNNSTTGSFGINLDGRDFEPNCTLVGFYCPGDSYDVTMVAKDANGNTATATGSFNVSSF